MKIADIRSKALRFYESKEIFRAYIDGRGLFPLEISLPQSERRQLLGSNFSVFREQTQQLIHDCELAQVKLVFKSVSHRRLGNQEIPSAFLIETETIFLNLISKQQDFLHFKNVIETFKDSFSPLGELAAKHPEKIIAYDLKTWKKLKSAWQFLSQQRKNKLYLRQVELEGIDTKFIENNQRILLDLLDISSPTLKTITFEERCGLKKEEPRLRFRLLDKNLQDLFQGLEDIETTVSALSRTEIPCHTVFVIENKVTGLCLPNELGGLAFFELGYKAELLKNIPWLHQRRIIYWGDIDTHGFLILSRLRAHFPHIESRLMNFETLQKYMDFQSVEESPYVGECPNLNTEEQALFQALKSHQHGQGLRLEQERIPLSEFKV